MESKDKDAAGPTLPELKEGQSVIKLSHPAIKLEIPNHAPETKELKEWPTLRMDGAPGESPFKPKEKIKKMTLSKRLR